MSAKNISSREIDWDNTKFISKEEQLELVKRCNPEVGDILLAKSGTIGIAAVVDRDMEFSLFESAALIKYNRCSLNGEFLLSLLNSESIKQLYAKNTKGNSIKHLHLVDIRGLDIPIPPMKVQEKFSRKLISMLKYRSIIRSLWCEHESNFNSLMQKAFRGELNIKRIAA